MIVKDYKELDVWKKGIEIVDLVYEITAFFPDKEKFGLISQMQRSAVSIPSNIAEGFARQHTKEYKQFLFVALGSCAELDTQANITQRRNYINEELIEKLMRDINHESRMLMNLIKALGY